MIKQLILGLVLIQIISIDSIICEQDSKSKYDDWPEPEFSPPLATGPFLSNKKCDENLYRRCNVPKHTKEELENVRLFLNYTFMELADVKPDKPLCRKLHVRKDWKCLTENERIKIINVWKSLYKKNIVQMLADLHYQTWPAWHKSVEFYISHRWLQNQFENYMRIEDPTVALPYWIALNYGTHPERSSIWDTLGHSGNYSNGYCVPDGLYNDINLILCIKRHWSPRGTIYPWATQEFLTTLIQTSPTLQTLMLNAVGLHFGPHLNVGGDEGQYSIRTAPMEILFYMHHSAAIDIDLLHWQLLEQPNLTPLSYSSDYTFDRQNGNVRKADIFNDTLTGIPKVTVRELFWIGFGDFCFIPDRLIKPINDVWNAKKTKTAPPNPYIPDAIKRLPNNIKAKYYPQFLSKTISPFASLFEDVGQCNSQCLPLIKPTFMRETWNGKRQFAAYEYDNYLDISLSVAVSEKKCYEQWKDLNSVGYCSPYVTP